MREIKFRAWDKRNKYWYYFSLSPKADVIDIYETLERLGQYTGLKDKNGKEIYESDVIEYPVAYLPNRKGVVVFRYSGWFTQDEKGNCHSFFGELIERGEIIGNIY